MTDNPTPDQRLVHGGLRAALIGIGLVIALSSFYVAPHVGLVGANPGGQGQTQPGTGTPADNGPVTGTGPGATGPQSGAGAVAGGSGPGAAGAGKVAAGTAVQCAAGKNGGKTDVGVDGKNINLAATEVESGIGSSFLAPVRFGMLAVQQKVNRAGGVCGRLLQLTMKDDGWDAALGKQYIDNFIQSNNYFALAVVPSSEGLNAASGGHDIDNAPDAMNGGQGIPVIGTDGMLNSQYSDPWIWPVAASTATSMRIMARNAHNEATKKHAAQTFAIVYNQTYKFGVEGKAAFVKQVARDGGTIPDGCVMALSAGQTSYKDQVNEFNSKCGKGRSDGGVSSVALLLEPQTAETWLQDGPYMGVRNDGSGVGAGGPQPLFDDNFGNACGQICANMQVWTSFYPPIFPYDQKPEVQAFKHDLCAVDSHCDVDGDSAFTEGGYVGMDLLVKALTEQGKTGLPLTRANLRAVLDNTVLSNGLSGKLTFKPGNHGANQSMVAFRDNYGQQFAGFQIVSGSEQSDPCPNCKDGD